MVKKPDKKRTKDKRTAKPPLPKVITPETDAPVIKTAHGSFDLEDPVLPAWIEAEALRSGHYPYDNEMKGKAYDEALKRLQIELVKLQHHVADKGLRIVILFEGRDAAGKGGAIKAILENTNPRTARSVALSKPTETERGQWYFQRYVAHLPTAGEIVLFDRSWYNRAGVERVMGFCKEADTAHFLRQAPAFEKQLVDDGIIFFKFWLDIGRTMQLKRFYDRRHNPLKIWKLSPIDYAALTKWDDYTKARDAMLKATHTRVAPWSVVLANDKGRAHIAVISHILSGLDYAGKDDDAVGRPDAKIFGSPRILA